MSMEEPTTRLNDYIKPSSQKDDQPDIVVGILKASAPADLQFLLNDVACLVGEAAPGVSSSGAETPTDLASYILQDVISDPNREMPRLEITPYFYFDLYLNSDKKTPFQAILILSALFAHDNCFLHQEVGRVFMRRHEPKRALPWIILARRFRSRLLLMDKNNIRFDLCVYAGLLADEAEAYAALGDYQSASRSQLLHHAFDIISPDYSRLAFFLSKWQSVNITAENILQARMEMAPIVADLLSLIVNETNNGHDSRGHQILLNKPLEIEFCNEVRAYGSVSQKIPNKARFPEQRVDIIDDGICYVDYWKTAVYDSYGRIIRSQSNGAVDFCYVAERLVLDAPAKINGRVALASSRHGWYEYYHWLIQAAPRLELLRRSGQEFDYIVAHGASSRQYCKDFLSAAGLSHVKILDDSHQIRFSADQLIIPSYSGTISTEGLSCLREVLLGTTPPRIESRTRVFISRQKATARHLINETELMTVLSQYGFINILLEELSIKEQAELLASAEIVLGPRGAGLSNVVFCSPDTHVIELIGEGSPACYAELCGVANLSYSAVFAEWEGAHLRVDLNLVCAVLQDIGLG